MKMTTSKRLKDDDVKAIFECLHLAGKRPPPHLTFKIVKPGRNGMGLSPPSFEFEDGLYVLLQPDRKKKNHSKQQKDEWVQPCAPEHLKDLVVMEMPEIDCPWSLSGPQSPARKATSPGIQQRYCYPRGREEYSSQKGGALWTMVDADGKEDKRYRILHVYLSQKRAANKGAPLSKDVVATTSPNCQQYQQQDGSTKSKKTKNMTGTRDHDGSSIQLQPRGDALLQSQHQRHRTKMQLPMSQAPPLQPLLPPPPLARSSSSSPASTFLIGGEGGGGTGGDGDGGSGSNSPLSFDMNQAPFIPPCNGTTAGDSNNNSNGIGFPSSDRNRGNNANFVSPFHTLSHSPPPPSRPSTYQRQPPFESHVSGQNVHHSPLRRGSTAARPSPVARQSSKEQQQNHHPHQAASASHHAIASPILCEMEASSFREDDSPWTNPFISTPPRETCSDFTTADSTPSTVMGPPAACGGNGQQSHTHHLQQPSTHRFSIAIGPPAACGVNGLQSHTRHLQQQTSAHCSSIAVVGPPAACGVNSQPSPTHRVQQPFTRFRGITIESKKQWKEYLQRVHETTCMKIMSSPANRHGQYVSTLAAWARHVAKETHAVTGSSAAIAVATSGRQEREDEQREAGGVGGDHGGSVDTAGRTVDDTTQNDTPSSSSPATSSGPNAAQSNRAGQKKRDNTTASV